MGYIIEGKKLAILKNLKLWLWNF